MKKLIQNYIFNPVNKKITFLESRNITKQEILLITNVTDNIMIYQFADSNLGGVLANNVLTLDYDTTPMSVSDSLQIWVEDTNPLLVTLCNFLNAITHAVGRISYDSSNQIRVSGSVTSGTITTVGTLTTGNIGLGDLGKNATAIMLSTQAAQSTIARNFVSK